MIISRAPLRVSFLGGGSDLPSFYEQEDGAVFGCAIKLHVHLTLYETVLKERFVLKYSETEVVRDISEIRHRIIKNVFSSFRIQPVNLTSESHVQAGTGLGSSSSFTVALLNLCTYFTNQKISREELAELACDIEINQVGSPIGKQDQYMSALGGLNYITFHSDESVKANAISISDDQLTRMEDHLVMYYVGNTRSANDILEVQQKKVASDLSARKTTRQMADLATEFYKGFPDNFMDLGEYLHEAWMLKRSLSDSIATESIDDMYRKGLNAGATGGKLLGAGGGGYLLFWCPPEKQQGLTRALPDIPHLNLKIDKEGPQIFDLR